MAVRAGAVRGQLQRPPEHGTVGLRVFERQGEDHAVVAFRAVLRAHDDAVRLHVEVVRAELARLHARLLGEVRHQCRKCVHVPYSML